MTRDEIVAMQGEIYAMIGRKCKDTSLFPMVVDRCIIIMNGRFPVKVFICDGASRVEHAYQQAETFTVDELC